MIGALNQLIAGLGNPSGAGAVQDVVSNVVGGLLGSVGGLLGGVTSTVGDVVAGASGAGTGGSGDDGHGLVSSVQDTVDHVLDGTGLAPVADLVDQLLNPDDGVLAAVTNPVEQLTDTGSGALGAVTDLVDGLVQAPDSLLDPVVDLGHDLVAGLTGDGNAAARRILAGIATETPLGLTVPPEAAGGVAVAFRAADRHG